VGFVVEDVELVLALLWIDRFYPLSLQFRHLSLLHSFIYSFIRRVRSNISTIEVQLKTL
jgi:hypothetical protein